MEFHKPNFVIYFEDEDFYTGSITQIKAVIYAATEGYAIEITNFLNSGNCDDNPLRTYKYKSI